MAKRERKSLAILATLTLLTAAMAGCRSGAAPSQATLAPAPRKHLDPRVPDPVPGSPAFFTAQVQPVFQAYCYRCHAGGNHRGSFRMDTPADLMRGGKQGTVIVPHHPEQSLLVQLIRHEGPHDDPMPMPPKAKLSETDIAAITAWVQAGAKMQ